MVTNELNSPKLKWLNSTELHDKVIELCQELKILSGVILHPMGKELIAQIDILKTFMLTHPQLANLTVAEVRHAFYLNNQGEYEEVYRHYNKELNAEFVGDVLRAYIRHKNRFYKMKGNAVKEIFQPEHPESVIVTEQQYRESIQMMYDLFLLARFNLIFPSDGAYCLLRKYGGINIKSREHYKQLVLKAMLIREEYGNSSLIKKDQREIETILQIRDIYAEWRETGYLQRSEYRLVIHTLRKRLMLRFFDTMNYFDIKNIFKEVTI